MAELTSGTSSFNLDLNNLVEDAFERCGQELRTGYDLRTARRSLNIMTAEWADRKSTRLNSSHIPLSRMPSSA